MALHLSSTLKTNGLVWVSSLDDNEKGFTRRVLEDLTPYCGRIQLPLAFTEPKSANDFLTDLALTAQKARAGFRPIIHIDTHGNPSGGIFIASTKEFVPWRRLIESLRNINIATDNNLCVVSTACCSMNALAAVDINDKTPFFAIIAPQKEVSFGLVESKTVGFYRDVFDNLDIMNAYEKNLSPDFSVFHCERLLAVGLARYVRDHCIGKGRRKRIEELVSRAISGGLANTPENRSLARKTAKRLIRPDQALIDRYVQSFLLGKKVPFSVADIIALARGAKKTGTGKSLVS